MKRILFGIFIWILLIPIAALFGQEQSQKKIVVLDPGHGGPDTGAKGINGINEKEVVLKIAMEVLLLNRELFNDTLIIYSTRYADTLISLGHRTMLAKRLITDAFVSIHFNQAEQAQVQGIEVYVHPTSSKDSERMASLFTLGLNQKLGFKNRGIKQADFQVLSQAGNYPSILLELGFLSNAEEAEHSAKTNNISSYALLILETLINFLYHD